MFRNQLNCFYTQIAIVILIIKICIGEPQTPYLALYSPRDTEYTDVLVRREHDNLTLVCEVRGDPAPRVFVWNYVNHNGTDGSRFLTTEPSGAPVGSRLEISDLQLADSGHYICSAPPFSSTKYVLVQPKGPHHCARGAFWCGARCVLPAYVCDGRRDCVHAEDEAPPLCAPAPCAHGDKLNCSSGRCIPEAACCRPGAALCRQPACCDEHSRYSTLEGYVEVEYPPLFEDRHAPDEYGFIQSTIYTVTACALIFMIAVVLLVSALCKMHMKRAALRGYASAHRDTAHHYAARYPPRYEAARLLEPAIPSSPIRNAHNTSVKTPSTVANEAPEAPPYGGGFGLARLSAIFCSRYRQVPTQCCDVEMTAVRGASLSGSPQRAPLDYRSPACCDGDLYYTDPDLSPRDLNYMATPVEFFRRRTFRRNTIDRVMDQLTQVQRPLTLQLGRFHLSIPRFRREEPRPDTPNVAEIDIDDLDFVRVAADDTYTLNGRTIRLLGANFENYPVLGNRPPPYNEAMRYKYGPPPEYLSREGINNNDTESAARTNVEMPPCYEDLASGVDGNANIANITINVIDTTDNNVSDIENGNVTNGNVTNGNVTNCNVTNGNVAGYNVTVNSIAGTNVTFNSISSNGTEDTASSNVTNNNDTTVDDNDLFVSNDNVPETISSVIDNLPAIDSDVNANETLYSGSTAITT
nr:uncharacterized protein LOC117985164 [Maniola hyperantus]